MALKNFFKRTAALFGTAAGLYGAVSGAAMLASFVPSFNQKIEKLTAPVNKKLKKSNTAEAEDVLADKKRTREATDEWLNACESEMLSIYSDDSYRLEADWFKSPSHRWVLILHGYFTTRQGVYTVAYEYAKKGYNCLVPDLRSQGKSEGKCLSMGGLESEDALLWLQKILELDPSAQIVVHGRSMGAATAIMLSGNPNLYDGKNGVLDNDAADDPVGDHVICFITDSAYSDAYEIVARKLHDWLMIPPVLLLPAMNFWLMLYGGFDLRKIRPVEAIARCKKPILMFHGTEDRLVPVTMAKELCEAAACEKKLVIVEGAGHVQSAHKIPESYFPTVWDFIEKADAKRR